MQFPDLLLAEHVWRDSRFSASIRIKGRNTRAHIANSGRLTGLLNPDCRIWVSKANNPNRITSYDLVLVKNQGVLVCIDSRLPNGLFEEAIIKRRLPGFNFPNIKREVKLGRSRIDFLLTGSDDVCWVETKSVTLAQNRTALFPDSSTRRGKRHLNSLASTLVPGSRAAVVFIIQRSDVDYFSPNISIDPEFVRIMREVQQKKSRNTSVLL